MARQPELAVWRRMPPEQRRRLAARLGHLVARQMKIQIQLFDAHGDAAQLLSMMQQLPTSGASGAVMRP